MATISLLLLAGLPVPAQTGPQEEMPKERRAGLSLWDVAGLYNQALFLLDSRENNQIAGVPAMLETCSAAGYVPAQRLLLDIFEGRRKGLKEAPEKAARMAYKIATREPEDTDVARDMQLEAIFRYATYLERGYGVKTDPEKAYRWMAAAARKDYSPARVEIARYLMNGIGHKPLPRVALRLLREQAAVAPETPNLFFYLGHMCMHGIGMDKPNRRMAIRCFEKGAELGDARAINNLGSMYELGIGVNEDSAMALRLYRSAAKLGNKDASLNMQRLSYKEDTQDDNSTPVATRINRAALRVISALPFSDERKARLSIPFTTKEP